MTAIAPLPDPQFTPQVEVLAVGDVGSRRTSLFRRLLRNPMAVVAMVWLVLLALVSVFSSVIAPGDPSHGDPINTLLPPGGHFPLGTDAAGVPEGDIEIARRTGCTKVNIDTDLRLAMTAGIRKVFAENPKEFDPRKYLGPARTRVKELVRHKVRNVLCCAGHAFD